MIKINIESKFRKTFSSIWKNYEKFLVIPILLVVLSVAIIGINYQKNGWFLKKGIDFSGGTEVILSVQGDLNFVGGVFEKITGSEVVIRTLGSGEERWVSFTTAKHLEKESLEAKLTEEGVTYSGLSLRNLGSSVSSAFFKQALIALIVAFILMSLVVFIAFRTAIPSAAAILSVVVDITIAIGLMSLFNIELTLGSLAALLMLIGYSVDTDILLSTRIIKDRTGNLEEITFGAMKTGLTMSVTSISAFLVLLFVSSSATLDSIAIVIIFGLLADIPSTWFQNAVILKRYAEKRFKK